MIISLLWSANTIPAPESRHDECVSQKCQLEEEVLSQKTGSDHKHEINQVFAERSLMRQLSTRKQWLDSCPVQKKDS